jgi:hypothetical protein
MTPPDAGAQASTGASEVLLGFGAPVPGDTPTRHEVGAEQIQPTCSPEIGNIAFELLTRRPRAPNLGSRQGSLSRVVTEEAERYLSGFGRPAAYDTPNSKE